MMQRRHRIPLSGSILLCLHLLSACWHNALAGEQWLTGFGTASLSCFTNDDAEFATDLQISGPGRTSTCDAGLDSTLGMQLDWVFGPLEFGLQGVAARNSHGDMTPVLDVAQIRWKPSNQTTLRFGRSAAPMFLYSETRQVRFAMPWVRPPVEVYSIAPFFTYDGIEAIYQTRLQHWNLEWHIGGGNVSLDRETPAPGGDFSLDATQVFSIFKLETEKLLLKMGYNYFRGSIEEPALDQLLSSLRGFGAGSAQARLASDLEINDSNAYLLSFGFRYDWQDWLVLGEYAELQIDGFQHNQYGAYLTLGRRFGRWMPYTTVARRLATTEIDSRRAGILAAPVQTALDSSGFNYRTLAVGLSYALSTNTLLKAQVDWIDPRDGSLGPYVNLSPTYPLNKPGSDLLMTFSLDFVF